jgi:hypothetical protein
MTDIVAIETAKAREQAERLMPHCIGVDSDEHAAELIVTALLEAKADVLAELDANLTVALTDEEIAELFTTPIAALRQEVWNRRARGL